MALCPGHDTAEIRRRFRRFGRQNPNVLVLNKEGGIQAILASRRHYRQTRRGAIRSWADEHVKPTIS